MKKIYGICLLFMVSAFSLFYYTSYQLSLSKEESKESQIRLAESKQAVEADNVKTIVVNQNMSYIRERYDLDTDTLTEELAPVPSDMVGLSRQELVDYLKEISKDGQSFELMSFSNNSITIRETIKEILPVFQFYLIDENGYLIIYDLKDDESKVATNISIEEFPQKEQEALMDGKGFESMVELYNYLESYTS